MTKAQLLEQASKVLEIEAQAILEVKSRLGENFLQALEVLFKCQGKVIFTGIGKSGFIARKLASTLTSTGTPAVYLHPSESSHGDLGLITQSDVVVGISYGGESDELIPLLRYVARKNIPLIAMTGKLESTLAKAANVALDIHVSKEACPHNLAPTASTTVSLALGDALAMALLQRKGFSSEHFAEFHPGGSLGRKLLRVGDVMHAGQSIPLAKMDTSLKEVVSLMTHRDVRGTVAVLNEKEEIIGVITDGDIRRRLEKNANPLDGKASDLMSHSPRTIEVSELAEKALFLMEEFRIQTLFVCDRESPQPKKPVGVLNFLDLFKAKIR
ncbi:MAG: KpsF/GutQ family sugar-phosphate isomerase [Bdellovibrionota bacterium]